ncbi:hypothetical protein C2S52_015022 [Perilla frutescens var. hirtella]|nr:hypothetical protein C2S52_015022 [Perilla frutescens var. hirtella]
MASLLLLLLLFLALPIYLFTFLLTVQHKSRRTPGRPPGPPLIGNLHQLDISKPHIWLAKHSNKYGPITFFKLCRLPVIVLSSADVAKTVFKYNDVAFAGRPYSSAWFQLSYDQSDIVGSPYSDYWRQMRKVVVHHLFSPQKLRSLRPVREDEVPRMIAEMSKKANSAELIDVEETAMSFTCSLLCRLAFGKKFEQGGGSWNRINRIMNEFWHLVNNVFKDMDSFYQELVNEHLSPNRPDSFTNDILDLLIQLREDDSAPVKVDWKHIKAILMNIFLGGTDTSGVPITWALTALMKKPSAMKKVQHEIRTAVVKETMRLYPAIPLVPKETTDNSNINGYEIQPKTLVFVNIWAICRDPDYWENPDEFLPERFLNSTIDFKGQHFRFIAFGQGRRTCPGN